MTIKDQIVEFLATHPQATANEVAEGVGCKLSTASSYVSVIRSGSVETKNPAKSALELLHMQAEDLEEQISGVKQKKEELLKVREAIKILEG